MKKFFSIGHNGDDAIWKVISLDAEYAETEIFCQF